MRFTLKQLLVCLIVFCSVLAIAIRYTPLTRHGAFYASTGLILPYGTRITEYQNTYGQSFHGDGRLLLIADIGIENASRWLRQNPPWSDSWKSGQLDAYTSSAVFGDTPYLKTPLYGQKVWYDIHSPKGDKLEILIVEKDKGTIYFAEYTS